MGLPLENKSNRHIYTISQITREIKTILETAFPPVWVEGEISNFKKHSSGHMYFVLKDDKAQIPVVLWRSYNMRLFFTPQDGMKVIAQGNIRVYEKRGAYQFEVMQLQPAGIGELQLAFEQLKQKLRDEGLFAPEHKKSIPAFPERIGIVTSPTGAAIQDMLSVFGRRCPGIQLILAPVRVQGEDAAEEIARAINDFNQYGEVDVLIIGRGGGSLEDLWSFNEEIVARAIFDSAIPVISAVGHEIDFSIADFVADLRAPTPSAAAELAVQNREEVIESIKNDMIKCYRLIQEKILYYKEKIDHMQNSYALRRPSDVIKQYQQRLDELNRSLQIQLDHKLDTQKQRIESLHKHLISLSPESILKRGYTVCFDAADGKIIRKTEDVQIQGRVSVQFYQGRLKTLIEEIDPDKKMFGENE